MSIEITVNEDIRDYEAKAFGNFTTRQAASLAALLVIEAPIYFLTHKFLGQATVLLLGIIGMPILGCGFWKPYGFRFEEYAKVILNNAFQLPIRSYRNNNGLRELEKICYRYEKACEKESKKMKFFKKKRNE